MLGLGKKAQSYSLACMMSDTGYSLVGLSNFDCIAFSSSNYFEDASPDLISKSLCQDVERYHLLGKSCKIILAPNLYQLVLMDALEVPEHEMAKAVRWQLKGLIEYPLNDIAVDAFIVPPHGAGGKRNKVFAAVTPQSALINKVSLIEECLLKVSAVSISELALSSLLERFFSTQESPVIVISYEEDICHLHVYFKKDLYLFRALPMDKSITLPDSSAKHEMLLEIQRSIDYCMMELKFIEPQFILFTPSFYQATDLFDFLKTELDKDVRILDVNSLFVSEPLAPEKLAESFYAIGGALMTFNGGAA